MRSKSALLALELEEAIAILDDALARRVAEMLNIKIIGTLGLLLNAKETGLIAAVEPVLDRLESLRFWLAPDTRAVVLRKAGEL